MSRPRSCLVAQRHEGRLHRIQARKAEPPCWGDRRIWADRRFVEPWPVHKTRGLRLMREHHLVVPPHRKLKAKRTPTGSKPRAPKPHEWWGIAMPKLLVGDCGWVEIVVVLDG